MTTVKREIPPASEERWAPYPELPRERKDMMQLRPANYIQEMLLSILTPGFSYHDHPTIYIASETPIYYGERPPGTSGAPPHVIPDCLVAFAVDTDAIWQRVGYDPIQNGKPPDFVMEVASRRTYRNDSGHKRNVYEMVGVPEYWRFDPTGGRFYGQAIIGERLVNGRYERLPMVEYDDGSEGATSAALNLNFRWRERRFWIHNPDTGAEYEHPQEMAARLKAGKEQLQAEIARLEEENRRLRGEG